DVAVDIAVIVVVRPYCAGKTADRGANRRALDHADARNYRADRSATRSTNRGALGDIAGLRRLRARTQRDHACKREGNKGFTHRSFSRLLSCRNMLRAPGPPATVHVTCAGTTIAAHRSATATIRTKE